MQAIRQASRPPAKPLSSTRILTPRNHGRFPTPIQVRLLSTETRAAIDKAVATSPVVLFMKGTPETPQCGFSRASIQILGLQGVDPGKFTAFNVLEDEELRQGTCMLRRSQRERERGIAFGGREGRGVVDRESSRLLLTRKFRNQRILGVAHDTTALRG